MKPVFHSEPLAARMRPQTIDEFVGQDHLLGQNKPLRQMAENHSVHSMILWGPPGSGKTTLANLLAQSANARVEKLSAVLAGVKDIREVVARAEAARASDKQDTILFVDEVHRFNKAQQDAFLPYVENGTLILIGATTENPSFELNNALLSRARVYVLKRLKDEDLLKILDHALLDKKKGLGNLKLKLSAELKLKIVHQSDGDARQVLNLLEILADFSVEEDGHLIVPDEAFLEVLRTGVRRFDKGGDYFYDQISALHKSVRGSAPDAALYWFARMIDGGCDPEYLARRIVRMASEDIGNADPRALSLTIAAWDTYLRLGSPEGELALAQAVVYLAVAPKSNAVYLGFGEAMQDARKLGTLEVPLHIRNAPTSLMRNLDYGKNYRYAHDEPGTYAAGENYFPESMGQPIYYRPTANGLEIQIGEKLAKLRERDKEARKKSKK